MPFYNLKKLCIHYKRTSFVVEEGVGLIFVEFVIAETDVEVLNKNKNIYGNVPKS